MWQINVTTRLLSHPVSMLCTLTKRYVNHGER